MLQQPLASDGSFSLSVKEASIEVRRGFVRKVYGILATQLLLTVAVAAPFTQMEIKALQENQWMITMATVVSLAAVCALGCCPGVARTAPLNYLLLFVFTIAEGVLVGVVCAMYTLPSVLWAIGLTAIIFLWLTAYAFTTKTDFTGYGPYLFAAVSGLLMIGLLAAVLQMFGVQVKALQMVYCALGIVVFIFYIIFDTQMMLGEWGGHQVSFSIDDYVFAALNLYLDIINLFLYILQLFGDKRD